MQRDFDKEKVDFLKKKDKSKKSSIDRAIVPIINLINSKSDYYTTSSCAGRIVLLEKLSSKKSQTRWLLKKHGKINAEGLIKVLKIRNVNQIWLKQEPIIIHVRCRNLDAAKKLLDIARKIFKRAGIISISENKIVMEVIGSERIDTPISSNAIGPDSSYIKELVCAANSNFEENENKSKKFLQLLSDL